MRVRLVSESLWGGTGRVISWLASRLAEDGHAVTLVLRSREGTDWYTPDARVTISREFSLYGWRSPMPSGGAHLRSFRAYARQRSEEHTSELQSLMRISYAVFCLKKKNYKTPLQTY